MVALNGSATLKDPAGDAAVSEGMQVLQFMPCVLLS